MEPAEYERMDTAEDGMWWYRGLHARVLDALRPATGRVLDAGCGTGGLLRALARSRPDLDLAGVEWAEPAARRASAKSGAAVVRGSVQALPFADHAFDAAVAADVLCHAAVEPESALGEFARVLRPGGLLIVNMPAYRWLLSEHDRRVHNVRRQSAREVAAMLAASGFASPDARYWNGFLLPLMIVRRKLAGRSGGGSDVAVFPPWADAMFHAAVALERRLPVPLPAGGSVLATATRP